MSNDLREANKQFLQGSTWQGASSSKSLRVKKTITSSWSTNFFPFHCATTCISHRPGIKSTKTWHSNKHSWSGKPGNACCAPNLVLHAHSSSSLRSLSDLGGQTWAVIFAAYRWVYGPMGCQGPFSRKTMEDSGARFSHVLPVLHSCPPVGISMSSSFPRVSRQLVARKTKTT